MSASWQWVKANPDAAARLIRDLEAENAALRDLAAHRGAFIDHHRIATPAHSIISFNNEDQLAWEKLVERIKERDRVLIDAARSKEGGAT